MGNGAAREAALKLKEERELDTRNRTELLNADIDKLKNYYLGMMTDTAQFTVNKLDTSEIDKIRIGLFGPTGSGKSSFINTCERTLRRVGRGTANIQSDGAEGTIMLHHYLYDFFFQLVDTRGFFYYNSIKSFADIIEGFIGEGETIASDEVIAVTDEVRSQKRRISDQLNVVLFFVSGDDPNLSSQSLHEKFSKHRKYLQENDVTAITVVTRFDKVPPGLRQEVKENASRATGSPANKTFFITNYIVDDTSDLLVEEGAIKVLQYALAAAEQTIRIKLTIKQRESANNGNLDVTVISKIPNHPGQQEFVVPVQFTLDDLMNTVKPHFKTQEGYIFYFTTAQGKILPGSAKVQGLLGTKSEIHLQAKSD